MPEAVRVSIQVEEHSGNIETDALLSADPLHHPQPAHTWRSYLSVPLQYLYLSSACAFTVSNRYFLLKEILELADVELTSEVIWAIVGSDTLCATLFSMTNELCEASTELANFIEKSNSALPHYAKSRVFSALAGSQVARGLITFLGSIEHALIADILPLLVFIPKQYLQQLALAYSGNWISSTLITQVFSILIPMIGIPITLMLVLQTLSFEGQHSHDTFFKHKRQR